MICFHDKIERIKGIVRSGAFFLCSKKIWQELVFEGIINLSLKENGG